MNQQTNAIDPASPEANAVQPPPEVDARQGYPQVVETDATPGVTPPVSVSGETPETPAEPQTPAEGVVTPPTAPPTLEEATATAERLKQTVARNNKVLSAMGLDPMSDIGEQLENGLITADDVRKHVAGKFQVPQAPGQVQPGPESVDPVAEAEAVFAQAKADYDKETLTGGISIETNTAYMNAIQAVNAARQGASDARLGELTAQITAGKKETQVNESAEVVLEVARNIDGFDQMAPENKAGVEQVTLALTGFIADAKTRSAGGDPTQLTPAAYAFYAKEAENLLGGLAEHFREQGRAEGRAQFTPPGGPQPVRNPNQPNPPIMPAGNTGDPVPIQNPNTGANYLNHRQLAKNFEQSNRRM